MTKNNGDLIVQDCMARVIFTTNLRIGDRVEMAVRSNDSGWATRKVLNGTRGTCIGFVRNKIYCGRVYSGARNPGVFEENGAPIILWDNGITDRPSTHDLVFAYPEDAKSTPRYLHPNNNRPDQAEYQKAFETLEFVSPLPDLPFWEWDVVQASSQKSGRDLWGSWTPMRIQSINWNHYGDFCTDGVTPMPVFNVSPLFHAGGTISVRPDKIRLVERGPIWKWYNDRANLVFKSLKEEIKVHTALGLRDPVRNLSSGDFIWSADDVRIGLDNGVIDHVHKVGHNQFRAYKFHDEDLGRRFREHQLCASYL